MGLVSLSIYIRYGYYAAGKSSKVVIKEFLIEDPDQLKKFKISAKILAMVRELRGKGCTKNSARKWVLYIVRKYVGEKTDWSAMIYAC